MRNHILFKAAVASLFIAIAFTSCTIKVPREASTTPPPADITDCSMVSETLVLGNQTAVLPKTGKFVLESHLVTSEEFLDGTWPKTGDDRTDKHIARSCNHLKAYSILGEVDCNKWYANRYVKVWTPSENGKIGQGSISTRPPIDDEMWSGNMMWTSKTKPKPGTKFLATLNGKSVVVSTGWETGPGSSAFLGGLQGEVMYYLSANNSSQIKWGRLKDQSLPLGPIVCQ